MDGNPQFFSHKIIIHKKKKSVILTEPLNQNLAALYGVSLAIQSEQLQCVLDKHPVILFHISNAISIMLIAKLVLIEDGTPSTK